MEAIKRVFNNKFIAYIDIIGFSNMIDRAVNESCWSVDQIIDIISCLGTSRDKEQIYKYGPFVCPQSSRVKRDLDFELTQVSDCVIVSTEISPGGAIEIVYHCWRAAIDLLSKGVMSRGYITEGSIYHRGSVFFGTGYQFALCKERNVAAFKRDADERGTPFIEIDPMVSQYVASCNDPCVKEMYSRLVKDDGCVSAIFPFKKLSPAYAIGSRRCAFDPEKEKHSIGIIRRWLRDLKERVKMFVDPSKPDALRKAAHFIQALDEQLIICDRSEEMVDMLCEPFPPMLMNHLAREPLTGERCVDPRSAVGDDGAGDAD